MQSLTDSSLSAYRVDETAIQERPIGDSVLVTTNEIQQSIVFSLME